MKLTLAENVRACRKARRLTQEQFAEALGVTAGAVYKWESGISVPELSMLVEMADFFDVSVDALLGFRPRDNRMGAAQKRLRAFFRNGDPAWRTEAEKLLRKYPNAFEIVHTCAELYFALGAESRSREDLRRALELLEQSLLLITQNTDPGISEHTICGEMGMTYLALGEKEKGLELLKKNNAAGIFSDYIGVSLAVELRRPEEAEPYLAEALLQNLVHLISAAAGYSAVLASRGEYAAAQELLIWAKELLRGARREAAPDYLDKSEVVLFTRLAFMQKKNGQREAALASLREASERALRFDAAPNYGVDSLRFFSVPETASAHDDLGVTAAESVERLLRMMEDEELSALWKEAADHV